MDWLELIAATLHDEWARFQLAQGRVHGATRSAKTHPHLVVWTDLDEESRNQDRFIAALVVGGWMAGEVTPDRVPEAIHDAWVAWERAQRSEHPHARPFGQVHAIDPGEHALQARAILPLLLEVPQVARPA
jgi:hypothetical protein